MSTAENESAWSVTAVNNANSDANINWAEGQDPGSVNNSARSMMAARAKARLDQGGNLVAGGSANALTVTTSQGLTSGQLTSGLRVCLQAASTNTSASVTFAPDGLTAQNIKRADGSALVAGSISANMFLDLVYNSGTTEWWAANIPANASFSATKSGNQNIVASGAVTKVTFDGTDWNDASLFSTVNSRWIPPAGRIQLSTLVQVNDVNAVDLSYTYVAFFKNGALLKYGSLTRTSSALGPYMNGTVLDLCNGTDYYEVFVSIGWANAQIGAFSWFQGTQIS